VPEVFASSGIQPELAKAVSQALAIKLPNAQPKLARSGWRIEVTGNGRYWQWRKGSGKNRESAYGGRFDNLSEERKAKYHENIKTYARTGT
jgi:hypothetical protein